MLTLHDSRFTRRRFLSVGGLAAGCAVSGFSLGGLSLADLFAADAASNGAGADKTAARVDATKSGLLTGRSVIFLFQQGGPSQYETFDPKPEAPSEIRTVTGVTQTSLPGVLFGDTFERLAPLAHKLAIVRSFATGNAGHNIRPIVGPESGNTNLGSLYSRVAGATHPVTAMPTNAVLLPQSVANDVTNGQGRGDLTSTGTVGAAYAPFIPGGTGQLVKNLRLGMNPERFQDRESLRSQFDQLQRRFEAESAGAAGSTGTGGDSPFESFDRNQQQACEVLLSGRVADALDLSKEDPELVRRYDTSRFVARDNWKRAQRGVRGYYTGHAKSFGKALLLARRLCEAGCGFVTVHCDYEGVWDMHADGNNLNMRDGMQAVGRSFDHAVAEFIHDVEARGLSDRILLVATGEMGRTPRINRNGGRDHWAKLTPLMMYGGGAAQGKVIGQSTRDGGEPATDPLTTENLISTLLHATLDTAQLRLKPGLGAIAKLAEPAPFPGLL